MIKWLKGTKGFTIIDGVLATVVLTVGMLGAWTVMQNATLNTLRGDLTTVATQLANEKMEEIMADKEYKGYAFLDVDTNYPSEMLEGDFNGFTREVQITEVDSVDLATPQAGSGIKLIRVIVRWGTGESDFVSVATVLADYQT